MGSEAATGGDWTPAKGIPNKRFYLRLNEVLLGRPYFWALTKPCVGIGFSSDYPGCDVVLPMEKMGIDTGDEGEEMSRFRQAGFHLQLVQETSGEFLWIIDPKEGVRIYIKGKLDVPSPPHLEGLTLLKPEWNFCVNYLEHFFTTGLSLRFSILDMGDPEGPKNLDASEVERAKNPHSQLLECPDEVLGKISSFLEPDEFLAGLACAHRRFLGLSSLIPWERLDFGAWTYDVLSVGRVAKKSSLKVLQQWGSPTAAFRDKYLDELQRILQKGKNLWKLSTEHLPGLATTVPYLPALRVLECSCEVEDSSPTDPNVFILTQFLMTSPDIQRIGKNLQKISISETAYFEGYEDQASCFPDVTGADFFRMFSNLTALKWAPCAPRSSFWHTAPTVDLERLTRVSFDSFVEDESDELELLANRTLNVASMTNLKYLNCCGVNFGGRSLRFLETLIATVVATDEGFLPAYSTSTFWETLATGAPNLKVLSLTGFHQRCFDDSLHSWTYDLTLAATHLLNLEVVSLGYFGMSDVNQIGEFLRATLNTLMYLGVFRFDDLDTLNVAKIREIVGVNYVILRSGGLDFECFVGNKIDARDAQTARFVW